VTFNRRQRGSLTWGSCRIDLLRSDRGRRKMFDCPKCHRRTVSYDARCRSLLCLSDGCNHAVPVGDNENRSLYLNLMPEASVNKILADSVRSPGYIDDVYEAALIEDHEFTPRFSDPHRCGHVINGNWNSSTADVDYCNASADCHVRPHETGVNGASWMTDLWSIIAPGFAWIVLCVIASAVLFGVAMWVRQ